jgi:peptide/nickel transport system substrate-binding protein
MYSRAVVISFLLALFLVVPWVSQGASTASPTGTIRIGVTAEAAGLDPQLSGAISDVPVMNQIFDTLMRYDLRGKLHPWLAKSYKQVNKTTYRFTLRTGVKFQDGSTMTARDVRFSLLRARDPRLTIPFRYVEDIKGVRVVNSRTVDVNLKKPNRQFIHALSAFQTAIVPERIVKARGNSFKVRPVGTGPFQLVQWVKDDHITLRANKHYFLGAPRLAEVRFMTIPDPNTLVLNLQSNAIDIAAEVPAESYQRLKAQKNIVVKSRPTLAYYGLWLNQAKTGNKAKRVNGPFSDVRVRQALWHAVRWSSVYKSAVPFPAYGNRAYCFVPPASKFAFKNCKADWPQPEYNPDLARRLLTQAGYPKGFKTSIEYWQKASEKMAIPMQADLDAVGIQLSLQFEPLGTLVDDLFSNNYDLMLLLWNGQDNPDPYGWLDVQFNTKYFGSSGNQAFYQNPRVDSLLNRAEASAGKKRLNLYRQAHRMVAQTIGQIPIHTINTVMAWSTRVKGFGLDSFTGWNGGVVRLWQPPYAEVSVKK